MRRSDAELAADRKVARRQCRIVQPRYWIEPLAGEADLDGVLEVEAESFTNPWTRDMYAWELQNRAVCHILVVRTDECPVAGFCAFWLVFDEIHINNLAMRPQFRGQGIGTALLHHVLAEAQAAGRAARHARGAGVERAGARRLYERLGFYVAGTRRNYYTNPVEDALILWRDDPNSAGPPVETGLATQVNVCYVTRSRASVLLQRRGGL